ncbi:hypothetical protein C8R45DRAFT_1102823 [Mycena sanguinolenta]|nr:hypothetical protein C8R45DRAFT_1102823 [Mycena sanguinolenta]
MSKPIFEKGPDGFPIFKGFSPLTPGTYTIWSQKYSGIVVDLAGAQPNGKVQGYPTNNTIAQKWTLTPLGEDQKAMVTWEVTPLKSYFIIKAAPGDPPSATIALKGSNLLWTLTSGAAGTQIVLQNANGDLNQVWSFTPAQ